MEYFEWEVSDQHKAEIELNFFEYFNSKRYLAEPDIIEYKKNNKPQYDLILGVKTMKKYGTILDFKDKNDNRWWSQVANAKHQLSAGF